jgi:hypothetical protein
MEYLFDELSSYLYTLRIARANQDFTLIRDCIFEIKNILLHIDSLCLVHLPCGDCNE